MSFYLQRWPRLADILIQDITPYQVPTLQQLERACAMGERSLTGEGLLVTRLDMALAGLMRELGEEFFNADLFPDRLSAAADILLAARVYVAEEQPGDAPPDSEPLERGRVKLVRQLLAEAEDALTGWEWRLAPSPQQTRLYAAEEATELE